MTATELCYCIFFPQSNRHSLTKVSPPPPTYNLLDFRRCLSIFEWNKCALVNILCYVVHFNIGLLRSRVSKFTTVFCFSTMHTILIDIDMGGLHQSYLAIFDGASPNNLISGLNF